MIHSLTSSTWPKYIYIFIFISNISQEKNHFHLARSKTWLRHPAPRTLFFSTTAATNHSCTWRFPWSHSDPRKSKKVVESVWNQQNITWNCADHGTNIMLMVDIKNGTNIDGGFTKVTIYYFQNSKLSQMCFSLLKKCSKTQQKHAKV